MLMTSTNYFPMAVMAMPNVPGAFFNFKRKVTRFSVSFIFVSLRFVTVQHPHLTSPIPSASLRTGEGEETFPRSESRTGFPRPWWEGLGEGGNCYSDSIVIFFNQPVRPL